MADIVLSDRYRIVELIGSGGMANVYKAVDQKTNKVVAVKMLKDEHLEDAEFLRRFEREAPAVLSLSHENIVKSHDVGEDDGVPYIVLEYVEGSTVKEIIEREGALSPRVAVSVASQVLSALSHAHERGIIHRDVKPQNVIITPSGRAKLTDFGIARDVASTTRTFAGTNVIGSVHYLSPEQARGDEVTTESDIYSCGIMLYEMLLGEVPFGGENSVAIALKHLHEEITTPMEADPKIPRALSDIIVKATSKKPSMRYHSAAEMRADLQRALREPHGKFARIRRKDKEKHSRRYGILNIALLIVVFIGLFAALFFIIRAWGDSGTNGTDDYIIPTVEEKKIGDAEELAKLRGFEIFVQSYQTSTQYQEGVIISQEPLGGTRGKPGDIINVVVSSGSDRAVVPNVLEMTLPAATVEIEDQSLKVGNVEYVESERPDGEVVGQNPPEGTELLKNDTVDLQVSGTPGQVPLEMPNVTDTILNKALYALREDGFNHIWLRFAKPASGEKDEIVFKQNPAAAMEASPNGLVELWAYRSVLGDFSADIADNVDVLGAEQTVVVTLEISKGVEVVLYEAVLPVGEKQPVSFTGYFLSEGEFKYMVYLNGVKVHESTALFTRKNS